MINQNRKFTVNNINFSQIQSFNITLKKKEWKAYYYPCINFIENQESRTIQILSSDSIVLGIINFSII